MRVEQCIRCKGSHTVEVTKTKDSKGRPRVVWTCPKTGHKVNQFAPKSSKSTKETALPLKRKRAPRRTTTKEGGTVPAAKRRTTVTGGPSTSLRASIPMTLSPAPDIAAAWDVAEGILDGLASLHGDDVDALARRAASAYNRAKGVEDASDAVEHDFGVAIAEAIQLVAVHRGMSAADFAALAPPGLGSSARQYMGGSVVDFMVGKEGESGAAGIMGDAFEQVAGSALDALLPEGAFADGVQKFGAPIIAEGIRKISTGGF